MCLNMMRRSEAPSARAASTNSVSRSESVWPRMMRAMYGQLAITITKITTGRPGEMCTTVLSPNRP